MILLDEKSISAIDKINLQINAARSIILHQNLNDLPYGNNLHYHHHSNTPSLSVHNQSIDTTTTQSKHKQIYHFDRDWLVQECANHISIHDKLQVLELNVFTCEVFKILESSIDLESQFVDLMGYSNLEFIGSLVKNHDLIISNIMANASEAMLDFKDELKKAKVRPQAISFGAQVSVTSQKDIDLQKQNKKDLKKLQKAGYSNHLLSASAILFGLDGNHATTQFTGPNGNHATTQFTGPNGNHATLPFSGLDKSSNQQVYKNVYHSTQNSNVSSYGQGLTLPKGTEHTIDKDFEEFKIPGSTPAPVQPNEKIMSIDGFDSWIQPAFKGYSALNRVQSIVYPIAFQTNENLLVCAPTGAGKTDIALLAILRTISLFRNDGYISLDEFKVVYIAPMKALAAEIVRKFSGRLAYLRINVRELTGDMQLTKAEIYDTQVIVTTPEKWDVVTRKSVGDSQLVHKVKLLIIDEVHLLHEERGAVIETLVARTLRMVEFSQSMIRIVGLSATLPNYIDVATFLRVNPTQGLFFFDAGFRPIPLEQHYIGIKAKTGTIVYRTKLNTICYDRVRELLGGGHQVMIFVHSRKDTVKSAQSLIEEARNHDEANLFDATEHEGYGLALKEIGKSRNKEMKELFTAGIGIHHAGMLRSDRTMSERMFEKGILRVLCCTATLAWGVNLPAYAVIIKGTQLYNAEKSAFVDLSILDVLQIFGRAGRPQFEDLGVGFILTSYDKLNHYVSQMTQQHPIESSFAKNLVNNLNAEISLGTITNLDEAIKWLSYTYLYVRMKKNPLVYGIDWEILEDDPMLAGRRSELLTIAGTKLHQAQMIVFDPRTGYLTAKDLGRIASNYYIDYNTVETINSLMRSRMTEADVLAMLSKSTEFENIVVRQEELFELKKLYDGQCVCAVKGGVDTNYGKANILLQSYISHAYIEDFALVSDTGYVAQNSARIMRALFEVAMSRNWGPTASIILSLCKTIDKRLWSFQHSLLQFNLSADIKGRIENLPANMSIDVMRDMDSKELGHMIHFVRMGDTIRNCVLQFPTLKLEAQIYPITRTILRVSLQITPEFVWNDRVHGNAESFFIWVEDSENTEILYSDTLIIKKKQLDQTHKLGFTVPIMQSTTTSDGLPSQIFIRAISERWINSETIIPVSFKHLILPEQTRAPHTNLLNLKPLPITALNDPILEEICAARFNYFNPVQTQIFHTLYHTRENVLLGAPTGSGKTMAAELAMWASFKDYPKSKVIYIAPLKALVRERVKDWKTRLMPLMGRTLVELTGDVTPDLNVIEKADVIITTPEKWDGVSRSWRDRKYITQVSCVIIDEIHLLGGDRGPILEVIVSRMNYIASQSNKNIRIVGLSTALANAGDLADWLGIGHVGLFNFRHSVRPVPLEIYIEGYPGKHYCPRMISMNKPAYSAIITHSSTQPVIVFVSSRRQTRLTAQDFISLCANDDNPKRFLHMDDSDMDVIVSQIRDQSLKLALQFGIGLHHAGLMDKDRQTVEELFCNGKIQVLVATSTIAWGVNFPAHLVIVKGTEFYDAKTRGYKDFPITDVMQMMGRAGRPQFDTSGVAVILVHDIKKSFYKKFLHEPFPVESSLHECLHEHLNAEIATGSIKSRQDAIDYITWTYLFRRVGMNPSYYGCTDSSKEAVNACLSDLIEDTLEDLNDSGCIEFGEDDLVLSSPYGYIASYYYLRYTTMKVLRSRLQRQYRNSGDVNKGEYAHGDWSKLLRILSDALEYSELPVRHNEDIQNRELEYELPVPVFDSVTSPLDDQTIRYDYDSPHVKAFLLLQAHITRYTPLPVADYVTDTISVLDQAIRIVQAMIDVAVMNGYMKLTIGIVSLFPCLKQALWPTDSSLLILPYIDFSDLEKLKHNGKIIACLSEFRLIDERDQSNIFAPISTLKGKRISEIKNVIRNLPFVDMTFEIKDSQYKISHWFVFPNKEYSLKINVSRSRSIPRNHSIYSPRFPKTQSEGWFVVLGDERKDELIALKRVSPKSQDAKKYINTTIIFKTPIEPGEYDLDLMLLSDGYLGLDIKAKVRLNVN